MQAVSKIYEEILDSGNYQVESRLEMAGESFGMDRLVSLSTSVGMFSGSTPTVGGCISAEIDVTLMNPPRKIPRQAKMEIFSRLVSGGKQSEWLPNGVFYIDTRSADDPMLTIHGYDAMLKFEADYPESSHDWPATDITVVREMAAFAGVEVDDRTVSALSKGYEVQYPAQYTMREALGFIAAMYGGTFAISDAGKLRFIPLDCVSEDESIDIGDKVMSMTLSDALEPITQVDIQVTDDVTYTAGEVGAPTVPFKLPVLLSGSGGSMMGLVSPWATPTVAEDLLKSWGNFWYQPYTADVFIPPHAELGDTLHIDDLYLAVYKRDLDFGVMLTASCEAPCEQEIDHEFPYTSPTEKAIRRARKEVTEVNAKLVVQADQISASAETISSLYEAVGDLSQSMDANREDTAAEVEELRQAVNASITSDAVDIKISEALSKGAQSVETETGFRFDKNGLDITKTDAPTQTHIDENGMTISESGNTVLTANNQGVDARNLRATTYLTIGTNSRFEDFGEYTACFWIGG